MKKLGIFIIGILISSISYSQLSEDDSKKLENIVYESLKKDNNLKMERITTGGNLSSCELDFNYVYRDYRSQSGKPVIVSGSFSLMYFKNKNILYSFKIVPSVLNIKTEKFNYIKPEYSDFFVFGNGLSKFQKTEFNCDPVGKCVGYPDPNLKITELITSQGPFDGEIKFSFTKGGMDNSFYLSSILPKVESEKVRRQFNNCISELLNIVVNDIKTTSK